MVNGMIESRRRSVGCCCAWCRVAIGMMVEHWQVLRTVGAAAVESVSSWRIVVHAAVDPASGMQGAVEVGGGGAVA